MNIVWADLPAHIVWEIKLIWDPCFSYGTSLQNWFHKKEDLKQPELVYLLRPHHSTEYALVNVLNDIHSNSDSGLMVLVLQDLSTAFDTVSHNILPDMLENWVWTFNRDYFVSICNYTSEWMKMTCGVLQGSIPGHVLFNIYMLYLAKIKENNKILYHSYADVSLSQCFTYLYK